MLAKRYLSEIVSINNLQKEIFTLKLKSLGRKYKYHPGQFLHLAIDENYDGIGEWPESRCFSFQSTPQEEHIRITYSIKGKFTQQMKDNLHIGKKIWLKLPYGDLFLQPHNKKNTIFIAGGTGITPFLSLFNHSSFNSYTNPILYAGFQNQSYNHYINDIDRAIQLNPQLKYIPVYENKKGILNIHKIFLRSKPMTSFFISGPPNMIFVFKQLLMKFGVDKRNILTDEWE